MVKLNKIYTRTGDKGDTGLGDGTRRSKDDPRVAAYGTVDELNATLGVCLLHLEGIIATEILQIQNDLFDLGADLCMPENDDNRSYRLHITQEYIDDIERMIDSHNSQLQSLKSFILPGGSVAASHLHIARTVARRAERETITLLQAEDINPLTVTYLNRLSDYLFVIGRIVNDLGKADILWQPGRGTKPQS